MTSTTVLIGESGLAALVRSIPGAAAAEASMLCVRDFGTNGELSARLAARVREWGSRDRPSSAELRIRAYPRLATGGDPESIIIDKQHTRLFLAW